MNGTSWWDSVPWYEKAWLRVKRKLKDAWVKVSPVWMYRRWRATRRLQELACRRAGHSVTDHVCDPNRVRKDYHLEAILELQAWAESAYFRATYGRDGGYQHAIEQAERPVHEVVQEKKEADARLEVQA